MALFLPIFAPTPQATAVFARQRLDLDQRFSAIAGFEMQPCAVGVRENLEIVAHHAACATSGVAVPSSRTHVPPRPALARSGTAAPRTEVMQIERRESRTERRRDGSTYERPHFAAIAQAKSYRNGVLSIIPQDVQIRWKEIQLSLGKNETITESVIDEKRAAVLRFAAAKAIPLNRRSIDDLTLDQLAGLGDAAREGRVPAFVNSVRALGLDAGAAESEQVDPETGEVTQDDPKSQAQQQQTAKPADEPAANDAPKQEAGPADDDPKPAAEPTPSETKAETAKPASGKKAPSGDLF